MLAMSPTVRHFSMPGMPHRSFSIDCRTMLITCDNAQQFNTPSWWRGGRDYVPLTPAEIQRLDLNHMEHPVHDGDHFRVVVRYEHEDVCIFFHKIRHFSIQNMPNRSFSMDSSSMLISCWDGRQFNTPSWWRGNQDYVPLTQAEIRMLDLNHMGHPVHDGDHFRVVIRYNNEDQCIYFKKVVNTPSA